ncbi:MAG: MBL fold metallo-hydrolase [Sphingomonadaceae bacterium]
MLAGFAVKSCEMPHGPTFSTAYRFEADGKIICYATDFSEITRDMVDLFSRTDILVVDCLRREAHPTHAHLAMALELAQATRAGRTVLTHMDKSLDYATLSAEVPDHVLVGYDGLELEA